MDASALAATVERTLDSTVFHSGAPTRAVIVGSAKSVDSGGYAAHIVLLAVDGTKLSERSLTTEGDCRSLDESIAVVVSLMVDSLGEPHRPPPPPVVSTPATVTAPAPPAPAHALSSIALGFGSGVSTGLLPGIAPLVAMRAEVEPTAFVPIALTSADTSPRRRAPRTPAPNSMPSAAN